VAARLVQLQEETGGEAGTEPMYFVPKDLKQAFNAGGIYCTSVSECARKFSALTKVLKQDGPSGEFVTCIHFISLFCSCIWLINMIMESGLLVPMV
jgi:hypothetical protein